jgi:hypothetical protein
LNHFLVLFDARELRARLKFGELSTYKDITDDDLLILFSSLS